jgi:hypothetical protein
MTDFVRVKAIFTGEECSNCIDYFQWDNNISYTLEEEISQAIWNKIIHGEKESEKELKSHIFNVYYLRKVSRIFEWIKMIAIPSRTRLDAKKYKCPTHMSDFSKEHSEDTMFIFMNDAAVHFKNTSVFIAAGDALVFDEKKEVALEALDGPVYLICLFILYKKLH